MSVASEITRIQNAKASLKTSINAKTDSQHQITTETIDDYANFVDSITGISLDVPSGYTIVDYIESSGTQYIDTGYVANANTKIEIKCSQVKSAGGVVFGSRETASPTDLAYALGTNAGKVCFYYNTLNALNSTITTGEFADCRIRSSKVSFNFNQYTNLTINQFPSGNLYLFAINRGEGQTITDYSRSKIRSFIIYENDKILHYYVACYRNSDNVGGMYDFITNEFKTNDGTGSFTYL